MIPIDHLSPKVVVPYVEDLHGKILAASNRMSWSALLIISDESSTLKLSKAILKFSIHLRLRSVQIENDVD